METAQTKRTLAILLTAGTLAGCASGVVPSTDSSALEPGEPGYWTTLQIRWLGSASYLIQLGDVAVLTDPFFTYQSMPQVLFARTQSNPRTVAKKLGPLPVADAILVGHSHYDHMLDLAATLERPEWHDTPVFGGVTVRNILCGYGESFDTNNWRQPASDGTWHGVVPGLEYQAMPADHAPNFQIGSAGVLMFPGGGGLPSRAPKSGGGLQGR